MAKLLINKCPACGSSQVSPFLHYDSFPAIIFPVEVENSMTVKSRPLSANYCKVCQHIYTDKIDDIFIKSIYDNYYYLYPYEDLESMNDSYRMPFENTIETLVDLNKCSTLLEIGTDSVVQLKYFIDKGISCTAINPHAKARDNVRFIDGYYSQDELIDKFDLIISRFNLEHIIDPTSYLSSVKQNSFDHTVVVFQVPNVEYFIKNGMLNILAHEHLQYFNVLSIQHMLTRNGFSIIYCSKHDEPSIICAATVNKQSRNYVSEYMQNVREIGDSLVRELVKYSDNVVVYGASMTLSSLLYSQGLLKSLSHISIVDDNPLVQGRCMPGTDKIIVGIDGINLQGTKAVFLLLNKVYHRKVLQKLQLRSYKGPVYWLNSFGLEKYEC